MTPTAENLADQIFNCLKKAAEPCAAYREIVAPKGAEERRFLMGILLFPLVIIDFLTKTPEGRHPSATNRLFAKASEIYLNRTTGLDSQVNLGEYVVWRVERETIISRLNELSSGEILTSSSFNSHTIKFGVLLHLLADTRKRAFWTDVSMAATAPTSDLTETMKCLMLSSATTFTRNVLTIGPEDFGKSPEAFRRFQTSLELGNQMLTHIYVFTAECVRTLQSIEAKAIEDAPPKTPAFNLFKRQIPAQESQRKQLVKRLFLSRCSSDPTARAMAEMAGESPAELFATMPMESYPEATVLGIMEQFYILRDQGASQELALKTLSEFHSSMLATLGEEFPLIGRAATLYEYLRHATEILHGHGGGYADNYLIDAITEIKSLYKR